MKSWPLVEEASLMEIKAKAKNKAKKVTTKINVNQMWDWGRKWQTAPVFLPGESQVWGSLVGFCLWGRTELDTTEVTQQQQQQGHIEKTNSDKKKGDQEGLLFKNL